MTLNMLAHQLDGFICKVSFLKKSTFPKIERLASIFACEMRYSLVKLPLFVVVVVGEFSVFRSTLIG